MDAQQILAFRFARTGLVRRSARTLQEAAACPASDFSRDAALLALAARRDGVTRQAFDDASDSGDLALAHSLRGAIHAQAPEDLALYGRALLARDDRELAVQLGRQVQQLAEEKGFAPTAALDEVAAATKEALGGGRILGKNELHEELRARVSRDLQPWCKGCKSHHVAPMLWRYAGVKAGARLDASRRYVLARPGRSPKASEAVLRFLRYYGPAGPGEFAEWAGVARPHADRLFKDVAGDLREISVGRRQAWARREDLTDLESPPDASGVRMIPPGDPFLQKPNRPLLAPSAALRTRLFRPVASPGAVFRDGRLAGLWRVKAKGKKSEFTVEKLGRIARRDLEDEARRIAEVRGSADFVLAIDP